MNPTARSIIRFHPELSGLSDQECDKIYAIMSRRNRRLSWVPGVSLLATFMGTLIVLCETFEWMDHRGVFGSHSWIAVFFLVIVPMGVAIAASVLIWLALIRVLLRPIVERELGGRRCLWCGYCLVGLEATDGRVRCPECGDRSPVRP